jgi:hypothetical protein
MTPVEVLARRSVFHHQEFLMEKWRLLDNRLR